jgi:hypothetical protein
MSQYFTLGSNTLWNPSVGPGELFMRSADAMGLFVGLPTGIGTDDRDRYEHPIDLPVFEAFVDALLRRYLGSTHPILRTLMEGFIVTAVVMAQRAGSDLPALRSEIEMSTIDVSVGPGGIGARADAGQLLELCAEQSRSMAR